MSVPLVPLVGTGPHHREPRCGGCSLQRGWPTAVRGTGKGFFTLEIEEEDCKDSGVQSAFLIALRVKLLAIVSLMF